MTSTLRVVPTPKSPVVADMSTRALDAITVVEAAKMIGLPIPFAMHFNVHSVDGTLRSYDEVVTWAMHMDAEVHRHVTTPDDERAHYTVSGAIAGAPVTVGAIDSAKAADR